jgi:hypothetical protein
MLVGQLKYENAAQAVTNSRTTTLYASNAAEVFYVSENNTSDEVLKL